MFVSLQLQSPSHSSTDAEKEEGLVINPPELFLECVCHPCHIPLPITPGWHVPGCPYEGNPPSHGHHGPCCVSLGVCDTQHSFIRLCWNPFLTPYFLRNKPRSVKVGGLLKVTQQGLWTLLILALPPLARAGKGLSVQSTPSPATHQPHHQVGEDSDP